MSNDETRFLECDAANSARVARHIDETTHQEGARDGMTPKAHGAVSAIIVLAVVGPATGLEAHLPTGVLWCRHPRARAPVFSSQVDEAKSAAQIDEEWFPAGADEETLKKHFRRLAAGCTR